MAAPAISGGWTLITDNNTTSGASASSIAGVTNTVNSRGRTGTNQTQESLRCNNNDNGASSGAGKNVTSDNFEAQDVAFGIHISAQELGGFDRYGETTANSGTWIALFSNSSTTDYYYVWGCVGADARPSFIGHELCVVSPDATSTTGAPSDISAATNSLDGTAVTRWEFGSMHETGTTGEIPILASRVGKITALVFTAGESGDPCSFDQVAPYALTIYAYIFNGITIRCPWYIGNGSTATYFRDEYKTINFPVSDSSTRPNAWIADNRFTAGTNLTTSCDVLITGCVFDLQGQRHGDYGSNTPTQNKWDGCTFLNGGTGQLQNGIVYDGCNLSNCDKVTITDGEMINCSVSSPSNGTCCSITTASDITGTSFTTDTSTDYAIEIGAAGTYDLTNVTFGSTFTDYINVTATTGTVTLNVSGGTSFTSAEVNTAGASIVVVSGASVTVSGLVAGTEVRAYLGTDPATATEIDGVESSGTSFTFTQSSAGSDGYIVIHSFNEKPKRIDVTYASTNQTIPAGQEVDRVALNP